MIDINLIDVGDSVKIKGNDTWFLVVEKYGDGTMATISPNSWFRIIGTRDNIVDHKKKEE